MVFKTKILHFKIENTTIKDTNGKRNFKRMLSFLFVDKRKFFAMKLSFEEFNLVFYAADRSVWLVLNLGSSTLVRPMVFLLMFGNIHIALSLGFSIFITLIQETLGYGTPKTSQERLTFSPSTKFVMFTLVTVAGALK